ncbi:hypothetical protein F4001_07765 [Candidatus Poribacteria bacterium]|nr:hypothetical protein [Candidatus Poribacteria bacterium]
MHTLTLAQCMGTEELEINHGRYFTIAKLLYQTLAADGNIPRHQLAAEVARTLPELEELGANKINEWAQEYRW